MRRRRAGGTTNVIDHGHAAVNGAEATGADTNGGTVHGDVAAIVVALGTPAAAGPSGGEPAADDVDAPGPATAEGPAPSVAPVAARDGGDGEDGGQGEGTDPSRRRRRVAAVVVGVAILSALGGAYVGDRLRSPAEAAADRDAPIASRITVPVTRQALSSSLALSGEIQYAQPFTVKLSGNVGLGDGDTAVVTRVPELDAAVAEGDALLDVSGRPVFLLVGDAPMYRSLAAGSVGPDVFAVEQALDRLGFPPGTVDDVFDDATEAALDAFYLSRGYSSVGPGADDSERLRQLRDAIESSEDALRQANAALVAAGEIPKGAELLALQQSVQSARDALPRTQDAAKRNNDAAAQAVAAATTARDGAITKRNAAKTKLDAASAPGAVNPDTGEPYTAIEIAAAQAEHADAVTALAALELELTNALTMQTTTIEQGYADIAAATNAKVLAEAQLADATKPPDTTIAQQAVTDAQEALDRANAEYLDADARIGTRLPGGEIVFVPTLPSTVTAIAAVVGAAPSGDLATLSSSTTTVIGRVGRADSDLVLVGAAVDIELRDFDIIVPGTVTAIGQPPTDAEGGGTGSSSGRLQVTVAPDDPTAVLDYVSASVRIVIEVASTGEDVLVVPVAALSVGGDGTSRVEVERAPVTETDRGSTEMVPVQVGLTAQGLVEVRPLGGARLAEGDRVVVGVDDRTTGDDSEPDATAGDDSEPDATAGDGDGDENGEENGDDSESGASTPSAGTGSG